MITSVGPDGSNRKGLLRRAALGIGGGLVAGAFLYPTRLASSRQASRSSNGAADAAPSLADDVGNVLEPRELAMTEVTMSTRTASIEHVTMGSTHTFTMVRNRLEASIPQMDAGIFELLAEREHGRALELLKAAPTLSIFTIRDFGSLLGAMGVERRAVQYEIGNPLTASKMVRHRASAGLYAPIRVLLHEEESRAVLDYDRPASVFGQFRDADVDVVARQLDADLEAALRSAAS